MTVTDLPPKSCDIDIYRKKMRYVISAQSLSGSVCPYLSPDFSFCSIKQFTVVA